MNCFGYIAKVGGFFGSPSLYVTIILLGLIFTPYKAAFTRTLLLVSFTMIYNLGLKSIWQVPLPQPLEGWALPSGHMHVAVAFWGWLAIEVHRSWFTEMVLLILGLVGYSLIHNFYHWPIDVLASIGFGSLSLFLFWLLNRSAYFHNKLYRVGYLLSLVAIMIFTAVYPYYGHKLFFWIPLSTLLITTLFSHVHLHKKKY